MTTTKRNANELPREYQAALRAELVTTVNASRRPWVPRQIRMTGVAVVAVAFVGSGTAFAYTKLTSQPVTDFSTARCYTSASVAAVDGSSFPGTTVAVADGSSVTDALAMCADLWRQGVLREGVTEPQAPDPSGSFTVPALAGCVLPDGRAAIIPGSADVCQSLGLAAEASR